MVLCDAVYTELGGPALRRVRRRWCGTTLPDMVLLVLIDPRRGVQATFSTTDVGRGGQLTGLEVAEEVCLAEHRARSPRRPRLLPAHLSSHAHTHTHCADTPTHLHAAIPRTHKLRTCYNPTRAHAYRVCMPGSSWGGLSRKGGG
eukprot:2146105-Rhodomonas_salina.1